MGYRAGAYSKYGGTLGTGVDLRVGETATWHQFVSAASGATFAGISPRMYYRDQTITAQFFGLPGMNAFIAQEQSEGGTIYNSRLMMSCYEHIGAEDRLTWNGEMYRIEGIPTQNLVNKKWIVPIKKGK